MKEIKISVIIPVYNTEKFLKRCIESVINQTLKDIEIIIINDGSTDKSLEIIKKIKKIENRIKILDEKNEGSSSARNKGLKIAFGKYVCFVDSDDYLEENTMLEELYNRCERNNLDICVFDYYNDFGVRKEYINNLESQENVLIDREEYIKGLISNKSGISVCLKFIKRELFIKNDIIFPKNAFMGEDLFTSLKLVFFSERIEKINKAYYNYVQHENQGTKIIKPVKKYKDLFLLYKEMEIFLKEKNEFYKYEDVFFSRIYRICRNILRKEYEDTELYNELKDYLLKNKKGIFNSKEYKETKIMKKLKFHLRSKIF